MISREEVEHVARLARLHFEDEELARLQPELSRDHRLCAATRRIGPLRAGADLACRGAQECVATRRAACPGLTHEEAMSNGPDVERGQFVVPRIG